MNRLLITFGIALVMTCGAEAQAASYTKCGSFDIDGTRWQKGDGAGNFNVQARKTSCRTARTIVRRVFSWPSESYKTFEGTGKYAAWTCYYRQVRHEEARVTCTARGGKRVRWTTAS